MKIMMIDQIAKVNYKYSFSLAEAIKEHGNEVTLIIDQKKEREKCTCELKNLFITDEKGIGKIKKLINYITSYKTIVKALRNDQYDVVHTQWLIFSPVDYYYIRKIKKLGIKLVVTIHDILPFNQKFYDFRYHKKIYELADNIIVQADNNIKRFDELFPEMAGKETMIPHGHFLDYADRISCNEARKHLNIQTNKIVLLFFGQIKKVKGVGDLLNAFLKVYKKNPDILLIIAGSVWKDDFSSYQEIIDSNPDMRNQIKTDIRYIPDEEVKYYYSAADCCILPYKDVYQSGVIQLAYAYGKPVIATSIGAFKEVVIDNKTGFLCEPNNPDDLAKTIERAITNQDRFTEMGILGTDVIKNKYSWQKIAESVIEVYRN